MCAARGCGLLWLDPAPLPEELVRLYQDCYRREESTDAGTRLRPVYRAIRDGYLARTYGYSTGEDARWRRAIGLLLLLSPIARASLDQRVMWLPARPGGRLIDVGCGSGEFLATMDQLGWDVCGVDIDEAALRQARRKGLPVSLGTLEEQNYPGAAFDAVTMSHVIEHLSSPAETLREALRILKPGGSLVVLTPNSESLGHRLFGSSWLHLDPPRHLYMFNSRTLFTLVSSVGFSNVETYTSARAAGTMLVASVLIKQSRVGRIRSVIHERVPVWARAGQLAESLMLTFSPGIGEEVMLISTK